MIQRGRGRDEKTAHSGEHKGQRGQKPASGSGKSLDGQRRSTQEGQSRVLKAQGEKRSEGGEVLTPQGANERDNQVENALTAVAQRGESLARHAMTKPQLR